MENARSSKFLREMANGPRIILVTGHFGSGKTEFAVSLAFALARARKELGLLKRLALCDLDVENPYFRSRERTEDLEREGVRVYSDPYHGKNGSELQTLDPAILAPLEDKDCLAILDTGGNASGAMILNQFTRHYGGDYRMLYVLNRSRPGTDSIEKVLAEIREIENTTHLSVTGLISNSHFIWETTREDVLGGLAFCREAGQAAGLPVLCALCNPRLFGQIKTDGETEIFPIGMHMRMSYLDKKA